MLHVYDFLSEILKGKKLQKQFGAMHNWMQNRFPNFLQLSSGKAQNENVIFFPTPSVMSQCYDSSQVPPLRAYIWGTFLMRRS